MKVKLCMYLESKTFEKVEKARWKAHVSRTVLLERLVEHGLRRLEEVESVNEEKRDAHT